jgi:hypothetical protein
MMTKCQQHIHCAHHCGVEPPRPQARDQAKQGAQRQPRGRGRQTQQQRRTHAMDQAAEHVAAVFVSAQPVYGVRRSVRLACHSVEWIDRGQQAWGDGCHDQQQNERAGQHQSRPQPGARPRVVDASIQRACGYRTQHCE